MYLISTIHAQKEMQLSRESSVLTCICPLVADWKRLMLDHVIPAIPDFSWSHATGVQAQLPPGSRSLHHVEGNALCSYLAAQAQDM